MPPLSTHRHGVGVVLLEGPLYAIGGNDGWSFLNTVERWDSQVRSWNYVAPMNTPRSTHGVSVINKKIFAIGGRDVSACLRSVEAFDPNFNRWTFMGKNQLFGDFHEIKTSFVNLVEKLSSYAACWQVQTCLYSNYDIVLANKMTFQDDRPQWLTYAE